MNSLLKEVDYDQDLSNSSESNFSVSDNYMRRIMLKWISDKNSMNGDIQYSVVDDIIQRYFEKTEIDYIVYSICVVNKNRGRGKRFYSNFYEIYYDIKNDGVAYISKNASSSRPNKYQLEQFIYLSNFYKNPINETSH